MGLVHADPAKALVMTYFGQLVADGYAEWDMLDNGDIELRFNTGETFLLAEDGDHPPCMNRSRVRLTGLRRAS